MRPALLLALSVMLLTACSRKPSVPTARELFEQEMHQRHIAYAGPAADGRYEVKVAGTKLTVALDNVGREYEREHDPKIISGFVDSIATIRPAAPWKQARHWLYWKAQPSDFQIGDAVHRPVTGTIILALTVDDPGSPQIVYVTPDMLKTWGTTRAEAGALASQNMDKLLAGKTPELMDVDGRTVGVIPVDSVYHASLVFAPGFKRFITRKLQWPVLVALPCRDFALIISEKDQALLKRLAPVVGKQYRESGYQISTEILRISDSGIKAIGKVSE